MSMIVTMILFIWTLKWVFSYVNQTQEKYETTQMNAKDAINYSK